LLLFASRCSPPPPPTDSASRQCRRNDATELAHADMTTLPKVDTICTALSLMPTVHVNTVRSFSTHGHQSAAKGSSTTVSRSDIRLIHFFNSAICGLMVRRWRLIGYFPILYNPPTQEPRVKEATRGLASSCCYAGGNGAPHVTLSIAWWAGARTGQARPRGSCARSGSPDEIYSFFGPAILGARHVRKPFLVETEPTRKKQDGFFRYVCRVG
jgi:hypothetical protein